MNIEIKEKRKLSWWWFLLVPVLLIAMLFVQGFGPSPEIEIGKETTFITEPLRENGLPSYAQHIINKSHDGVTPENNAAIPILQALWPMELGPEGQPIVLEALQMRRPDPANVLVSPYDTSSDLKEWILSEFPDADEESLDQDFLSSIVGRAMHSTWKPGELPTIDKWTKRNRIPLDRLVKGAALPKYYFPRSNTETIEQQSMIVWLLPDVQAMRQASRALCVRSMWHLSHDRHEECWQDLLACYRLARHTGNGFSIVHSLVAVAVESMANTNVHLLLHDKEISDELLQQIQTDIASLPPRVRMHQFYEQGERFSTLDLATRMASGTISQDDLGMAQMPAINIASSVRIDWNIVLKEINLWYDRYASIAQMPYAERNIKLEELDNDLQQLGLQNTPGRLAQSIISMNARSEITASTMVSLLLPALHPSLEAEDRVITFESLVKASLALARYRAKNGEYPEQLDELVPDFAATIPTDYYTSNPLVYRKTEDGFLLYSLFKDGIDNGGTDIGGDIVEGEYVSESATVDHEMCDLVVRIPKPSFKMPQIPLVRQETDAAEYEEDEDWPE